MVGYEGSMSRIASFVLCLALVGGASGQQKKRVAVMNFDYATVQSGVAALFGSNQDIGKGIADTRAAEDRLAPPVRGLPR